MIILIAGHTGAGTGAQCATTQFDEGAETIWLRNRVAEILTNKYGLVVLMDDDTASLKLLTKALSDNILHTEFTDNTEDAVATPAEDRFISDFEQSEKSNSVSSVGSVREKEISVREKNNSVRSDDFVIDLHFNAHTNPNARGTEAIVANDATTLELRFASHLAHATSDALDIPLRCIKSESETPHHRLAMLHLTPQSIILEVCFCTSPEDVEAYRKNREKLAADLALAIYELL